MKEAPRLYSSILKAHLRDERQMAFISGPRQVGKTTTCQALSSVYLDWDNVDDRKILLGGPKVTAEKMGLERLAEKPVVATLDELHKYRHWKRFLKGFYDTYGKRSRLLVTGSSRLDVYRRGGDSLMGRYFRFRMHPLSIAEVLHQDSPGEKIIRPPTALTDTHYKALLDHGGFPEPYVKRDSKFTRRWQTLRKELFFKEDVRDLTGIQELAQLEILMTILTERSSEQLVYSNLAQDTGVTVDTIRRWVSALVNLHFGFLVRPWFKNVSRSLRKEPKWFLRDWSVVSDPGGRAETFVACHLLKAVEGWTDLGLGEFSLHYLRDKNKREVDFLVVRDRKPWFLVEVKASDTSLSPNLTYFQKATKAPHAFLAVMNLAPVKADCFGRHDPTVVPARTLLSQLL